METQNFLNDFVNYDGIIEFDIQYSLSTKYGFDFYDLIRQLPKEVKNEEELFEHIKDYIAKSEFLKEIDEFNSLNKIISIDFY